MTLEKSQNFTYYAGIMLDAAGIIGSSLAVIYKLCKFSYILHDYFSNNDLRTYVIQLRKLHKRVFSHGS